MEDTNFTIQLEEAYKKFLSPLGFGSLRTVGRLVGVARPTAKKKDELIEEIIAIELGRMQPTERSTLGAPVKSDFVEPQVLRKLEELRLAAYTNQLTPSTKKPSLFGDKTASLGELVLHSPDYDTETESVGYYEQKQYCGQVTSFQNAYCLMPLDGRVGRLEERTVLLSEEQAVSAKLRFGDVVNCHIESRGKIWLVKEILSVNGLSVINHERFSFDVEPPVYPSEKIPFTAFGKIAQQTAKVFDWLLPVGLGCRSLVSSSYKAGASDYVFSTLKTLSLQSEVRLFVLLCGASPEQASEYQTAFPNAQVICATYEDLPEFTVFAADFLLERAKRAAETGQKACLFVQSLDALSRAFERTEAAATSQQLACSLRSETVRYLKNYFGAARAFKNGASLTIMGSYTYEEGNAAEEYTLRELEEVANHYLRLKKENGEQTIDFNASFSTCEKLLFSERERSVACAARKVLSSKGLLQRVKNAASFDEFAAGISDLNSSENA